MTIEPDCGPSRPHSVLGVAIGGLIALAAAMGIGRFIYTPILPDMIDNLGLNTAEAGYIASANFLGYLLGALAAASVRQGANHRTWLIAALAASAATTAAMGAVESHWAFAVLRFTGGVASAYALVFASTLVMERLQAANAPALISVLFAGVGSGIALSAVLTWAMTSAGLGWRWQWFAGGGLTIAALLAVRYLIAPTDAPDSKAARGHTASGSTEFAQLVVAYTLFGFGYVITATFISTLVRTLGAGRDFEAVIWLVVGLAGIPSVIFWNAIAGRVGTCQAFALACLVEAAAVALSVLTSNAPLLTISAALFGGTFVAITAIGLSIARKLASHTPQRSVALMTAGFGFGQMVGPTFAGIAVDLSGDFRLPSLIAAAALFLAALISYRIKAN